MTALPAHSCPHVERPRHHVASGVWACEACWQETRAVVKQERAGVGNAKEREDRRRNREARHNRERTVARRMHEREGEE